MAGLRTMIEAGACEAWRVASIGLLAKVADHSHQGELHLLSDWIKAAIDARPYTVLHTIRPGYLRDGKHRVERVPRSNGAVWLVFRKDGHRHRDFDRLYARQQALRLVAIGSAAHCASCNGPLEGRRADAVTCSAACHQRRYRQRAPVRTLTAWGSGPHG